MTQYDLLPPSEAEQQAAAIRLLQTLTDEAMNNPDNREGRYIQLCEFVRKSKLDSAEINKQLREKGLPYSRVSEIRAVAGASAPIWKEFQTGKIGFLAALKRARAEAGNKTMQLKAQQRSLNSQAKKLINLAAKLKTNVQIEHNNYVLTVTVSKPERGK